MLEEFTAIFSEFTAILAEFTEILAEFVDTLVEIVAKLVEFAAMLPEFVVILAEFIVIESKVLTAVNNWAPFTAFVEVDVTWPSATLVSNLPPPTLSNDASPPCAVVTSVSVTEPIVTVVSMLFAVILSSEVDALEPIAMDPT